MHTADILWPEENWKIELLEAVTCQQLRTLIALEIASTAEGTAQLILFLVAFLLCVCGRGIQYPASENVVATISVWRGGKKKQTFSSA